MLLQPPEAKRTGLTSARTCGAAWGHAFYSGELEQDVYVVGDVARAVFAFLIVFSGNVACARDIFNPDAMRRYPSRSPLMSKLFRALSRYLPALGGTPRLSGVVQPACSIFVLQRGRSCSTKPWRR
jgi:hypothetical protein